SWRVFALDDRHEKALDIAAPSDVVERFAAPPHAQSWRLLDHLPLSFPELFQIKPLLRQRHCQHLLCGDCDQAEQSVDGLSTGICIEFWTLRRRNRFLKNTGQVLNR